MAACQDRIVIIEDTRELQCTAQDAVFLRTISEVRQLERPGQNHHAPAPDCIAIGEVRGNEALDLLKAWDTGHPGGVGTIHANGPRQALIRLEQLVQEAVVTVPKALIAEAINVIVYIERSSRGRRVNSIARVLGIANGDYSISAI